MVTSEHTLNASFAIGVHELPEYQPMLNRCLDFLHITQVRENVPNVDRVYRHPSAGGFPFSTRDCGWIVSDCTAEGLKAAMALQEMPFAPAGRFSEVDLTQAADVLLSYQNDDGGFGTYDRRRASPMLEALNPAEVFGDIMVEYSYVECTSAVAQGLTAFRKRFPKYRASEIELAMQRAKLYIESMQRDDGSWYGAWGVCFTYGTMFGIDGLAQYGLHYGNRCAANGPNNGIGC